MGVFFSGTDDDELIENSEFHNFYFSLIVNNKNEMCAKVAFRAKLTSSVNTTVYYKDENGNDTSNEVVNNNEEQSVCCYNCDIIKPDLGGELDSRFLQVKERKEKEEKEEKERKEKEKKGSTIYQGYGGENWESDYYGWADNRWGKDKISQGKWEKGHEKGMMNPVVTAPKETTGTNMGARTYNMLVKLLSLDHLAEGKLSDTLEKLHEGFHGGGGTVRNAPFYYDTLQKKATEYYISSFPEDRMLKNFDKTFENCIDVVTTYIDVYPKLVEELSTALYLTSK